MGPKRRTCKAGGGQAVSGLGLLLLASGLWAQTPGDADGDGVLRALDAGVAANQALGLATAPGMPDCNSDAAVNALDVICILTRLPAQLVSASPANGQADVGLERETILRFSAPLDAATVSAAAIQATFGGETLGARLYLSSDRKSVTLFYDPALPASARVRVTLDGGILKDERGRLVDADADFVDGGTATVDFDTLTLSTVPGTAMLGRVFATALAPGSGGSVNVPLQGATITVDGTDGQLSAVTDMNGSYRLDPAPAGRFFVHIDGRTATNEGPPGSYYLYVGKQWETIPGKETLMMDMFLPLVPPDTLQPVSATQDTRLEFPPSVLEGHPELQGVAITVPADSLFADDGTRGGKLGIAPVPPGRMPGLLPPGLGFPVVITVQTDGATNFDRPAPVCFPNLPDPATGKTLPAAAESGLWSFNHDIGQFEVVGPMVVSDDERLICTKPGVGIPAPGWHGSQPGCRGRGPKASTPPPTPGPTCSMIPDPEVLRLFSAFGACVKNLGKLGKALNAVAEAIKLVSDLADTMGKALDDYKNGRLSKAALRTLVAYAKTLNTSLKLLVEQVTQGPLSPLGKLKALIECAAGILAVLEPICDTICFDPPDCSHWILRTRCCKLLLDKIVVDATKSLLDFIEEGLQKITFDKVSNILDALEAQLNSPRSSGREVVDPAILALLEELDTELDPVDLDPSQDVTVLDRVAISMAEASALDGDTSISYQGPARNAYALLESDDFTQRFRTDQAGAYQANFTPETPFALSLFDPLRRTCGTHYAVSPKAGLTFDLHGPPMAPCPEQDADDDGLEDAAEEVVGTNAQTPDTDGDGVEDGAELEQGTDPLDGLSVQTGIIATADTPGTAVDVCAFDDLVAVADSSSVTVFNAFNGMSPVVIARVDTPGNATGVACTTGFLAVADGTRGLAVVDISNPAAARVVRQLGLAELGATGSVQAVAAAGNMAYAGTTGGDIVAVDLSTFGVAARVDLNLKIEDLVPEKETLYAFTQSALYSLRLDPASFGVLAQVNSPAPTGINTANGRGRLFVGGGVAYAVHTKGYNTIDVSNPAQMRLVKATNTAQFGWKQIALNGSGLGVAAVDPIQRLDQGPQDVSLYDVGDPNRTDVFLTQLAANSRRRPRCVHLQRPCVRGRPPQRPAGDELPFLRLQWCASGITLSASFPLVRGASVQEGSSVRVTANVFDDVQVRNVEIHVDGVKVATDGNFPFEHRFAAPLRTPEKTSFTLRARASDTGGNAAWTGEFVIGLSPASRATEEK